MRLEMFRRDCEAAALRSDLLKERLLEVRAWLCSLEMQRDQSSLKAEVKEPALPDTRLMNIELTDRVVKVAFEKVAIDAEFMMDVEHLHLFLRKSALWKSVHSCHAMKVECAPHFDRIRKFVAEAEVACKLMIEFNRVVSALTVWKLVGGARC